MAAAAEAALARRSHSESQLCAPLLCNCNIFNERSLARSRVMMRHTFDFNLMTSGRCQRVFANGASFSTFLILTVGGAILKVMRILSLFHRLASVFESQAERITFGLLLLQCEFW